MFLDMERRLDTGVPLVFLKSLRENATGDVTGGWKEECDAMRIFRNYVPPNIIMKASLIKRV